MRRPGPEPPEPSDPLAPAAAVQTLEGLAALLRDLRRRHARSRRDSSLTYRELAARTGWSHTSIAEYFTARTLPPIDRFDALLEVLGATSAERRALATARDRIEEVGRRSKMRPMGPVAVPRQLPAAPSMFTGRTRELVRLDAALDEQPQADGTLVVSAIGGMGGIGKTSLALHWAHQHLDRFPDGQMYVNLRGFDPAGQPLAPATVVRGFLEALGVAPTAIPVEAEAQAGLYRSLVTGRRMLIVLDNARDTAQVIPLLPGGTACMVLITSRRQLTGLIATHGACSVALDVLPGDEARQVLARHLGHIRLDAEPDAASALLACCAGLPLALSIVAARAITDPHQSLTALALELAGGLHPSGPSWELSDSTGRLDALDAGEPQSDLRAVLSWSSQALPVAAARAFGLLGIAPGPDISLAAAACLLALPLTAARTLLRELDHACLIQRHAPERYRMHDLLRLHATEQAHDHQPPAEQRAALRRLVDFYEHTAWAGARLLAPHRSAPPLSEPVPGYVAHPLPDPASAVAWFGAEHASLLAAQQLARGRGWDAQVCRLAWALDPYHRYCGHLEDQAATWQLAVTCARQLPGTAVRAQAHQMLGDAYAERGRTAEALHHLSQALALAERAGDITGQGEIHHSLGGTWERHGDVRRALEHAQYALVIFQSLDNMFRRARALNAVGWLQARLGGYTEARANCQAALALLREHPSNDGYLGEPAALHSLGYIACCLHQYDQALGYYHQALAIWRSQGHSFYEADALHSIAEIQLAQRHPGQARDTWRQARELYTAQHRLTDAQRVQQQLDSL